MHTTSPFTHNQATEPSQVDLGFSSRPWGALSLPVRREITRAVIGCNKKTGEQLQLLLERIGNAEVRDAVLGLLCKKDYLIRRPSSRAQLLEALHPYAKEPRVQVYATLSLQDPIYSNTLSVCKPAARILNSIEQIPEAVTWSLITLGERLSPKEQDHAAKIAFILMEKANFTRSQLRQVQHNARIWYAQRHDTDNPWLPIVSQKADAQTVNLLHSVLTGSVRDPYQHPILKGILTLPTIPHEIGFAATLTTLAVHQICRIFGKKINLAATTSVALGAVLVLGTRAMWSAYKDGRFNDHRDHERLQAIALLGGLLDKVSGDTSKSAAKIASAIEQALGNTTINFLQSERVREAAKITLERPTTLKELLAIPATSAVSAPPPANASVALAPA